MTRGVVVAAALFAAVPGAVAAQGVTLRFAPAMGSKLTRVFQTHTRLTIQAPAAGAGAVLETSEVADLGGTTEVALPGPDGQPVLHMTVDSLRERVRQADGAWQESEATLDSVWFQLEFDERLRQRRADRADRVPEAESLVYLVTGVPGLILPPRPVRAGDGWEVDMAVPLAAWVMRPWGSDANRPVIARASVQVDSLVARGRDTLVYLNVRGTIGPDAPDPATATVYGGGVTGTLVWSTGWSAFVAAATRVRVHVAGRAADTVGGPRPRITIETTVRQQVRS